MNIRDALNIVQIILALLLTVVVLMQSRGAASGGIFGGDASSVQHSRRGFELVLYRFTLGLAGVFFVIALINSLISA